MPWRLATTLAGSVERAISARTAGVVRAWGCICTITKPHQKERQSATRDPRWRSLPCPNDVRSEEHTSELQSLMRISYAVFCLKKKKLYVKKTKKKANTKEDEQNTHK